MADQYRTTIVRIQGEDYPIKSDADPEYIHELGRFVEEKINLISSKTTLPAKLKREVLASILIADEYFNQKKRTEAIERKLTELNRLLEESLKEEIG